MPSFQHRPSFECGTCGRAFPAGLQARTNHINSTGHDIPDFECDSCPRYFNSEAARFQHMNAKNHFYYECGMCYETYPTDRMRTQHEYDDHNYCAECGKTFMNSNNLRMHLNSSRHRGHTIQCPFCKKAYSTATGVTHHVETGSCPNARGLDRDTVYKFIRSKDPNGSITNRMIGWYGSSTYEANRNSYNHYRGGWECYLCNRLFGSKNRLNQHLNSPTHQQSLYHCPNRACQKEFKTLAGIINHMESESCGYTRFDNVQRSIQGMISGDRLIVY